nr:glycosyltransferase [Parvularcula maris]
MADSLSSFTRKNPFGAIEAHRAAFGDSDEHVLIVKTRNLSQNPKAEADLRSAVSGSGNILILDEALTSEDRWGLMASCDIFLSLHRAEGFGLTIAEAMLLGKACVVTDWSGSRDFAGEGTAALVPYELIPVSDPYGVYTAPGQLWAEPSPSEAAAALKKLSEHPHERQQLGRRSKEAVQQRLSPKTVGACMQALLFARRLETVKQGKTIFWKRDRNGKPN